MMPRTLLAAACGLLCLPLLFGYGPTLAQDAKSKPAKASKKTPEKAPAKTAKNLPATEAQGDDLPIFVGVDKTAAIRKALQKKEDVEFSGFPLDQTIKYLANVSKTKMLIDKHAFTKEGIALDEPITMVAKDVTIERVLNRILEPSGMTWLIEDEVVKITTEIAAADNSRLFTRTYRVKRLLDVMRSRPAEEVSALPTADELQFVQLGGGNFCFLPHMYPGNGSALNNSESSPEVDSLLDTIMHCTRRPWFDRDAEGGTITLVSDLLVVRQTVAVHEEIEALLEALTSVAMKRARSTAIPVRAKTDDGSAERRAKAVLAGKGELEFVDFPLGQAISYLSELTKVEFVIDEGALSEEGIATDEPVTLVMKDVTLQSAIQLVLKPLGLTTMFRHGVVMVTTEVAAGDYPVITVYAVDDILDAGGMDGDTLIDLLMTQTSGPWFDIDQEGGEIKIPLRSALVVRQSQKIQAEILAMLTELRAGLVKRKPAPPIDPDEIRTKIYVWSDVAKRSDELATAIKTIVAPETWDDEKVILEVGEQLVIRQTHKTHLSIGRFVETLVPLTPLDVPAKPDKDRVENEKRADRLYTLAIDFLKDKNPDQARHWLQHLVKTYPNSPAAKRAKDVLGGLEEKK
jgi:hypothetical protein